MEKLYSFEGDEWRLLGGLGDDAVAGGESGCNLALRPRYGWAPRGERAVAQ